MYIKMKKINSLPNLMAFIILLVISFASFTSCNDEKIDSISNEKKILNFYFLKTLNPTLVSDTIFGTLNETEHIILVNIPQSGINISSLKASFITTNLTSIAIGNKPQESGNTQNNFSSVQNYTVTALDGSTQTYLVTVNVQTVEAITRQ